MNEIIRCGVYPQENSEPIPVEWLVLEQEQNTALVVSRYVLTGSAFNEEDKPVKWRESSLRAWLNRDFWSLAFTPGEQSRILTSPAENKPNFHYRTGGDEPTEDKVFVLSYDEAVKYFKDDDRRRALPTSYAAENGAWRGIGGYSWYWLRTNARLGDCICRVRDLGSVSVDGVVCSALGGVRPAMRIRL